MTTGEPWLGIRYDWRPSAANRHELAAHRLVLSFWPPLFVALWVFATWSAMVWSHLPSPVGYVVGAVVTVGFGGTSLLFVAVRLLLRFRLVASVGSEALVVGGRRAASVIRYEQLAWAARSSLHRDVVLWDRDRACAWCVDVDQGEVLFDLLAAHDVPFHPLWDGWDVLYGAA